jgi:hypothetical protein
LGRPLRALNAAKVEIGGFDKNLFKRYVALV